jgi:hypothetical protein
MPRYFFDFGHSDGVTRDHEGSPLPDLAAAKQEAMEALLAIAAERMPHLGPSQLQMFVRTEDGPHELTLTLILRVAHTIL